MVQPIRPQDATGVYRRHVAEPGSSSSTGGGESVRESAGGGRRSDSVSLSSRASTLRRVLPSVADTPDVRAARVEALREQIAGGGYEVDAEAIAHRLLMDGLSA
jgi:flagellar biosynthesis anti-sigma factor FlgM